MRFQFGRGYGVSAHLRKCFYVAGVHVSAVCFGKACAIAETDLRAMQDCYACTLQRFACFTRDTEYTVEGAALEEFAGRCTALREWLWFAFVGYLTVIRLAELRGRDWLRFEVGSAIQYVHDSDLRDPRLVYLRTSVVDALQADASLEPGLRTEAMHTLLQRDRYLVTCKRVTAALNAAPFAEPDSAGVAIASSAGAGAGPAIKGALAGAGAGTDGVLSAETSASSTLASGVRDGQARARARAQGAPTNRECWKPTVLRDL